MGAGTVAEQDRIDADSPGRLNVELLGLARLGSAP
jgi:hypothetical protein